MIVANIKDYEGLYIVTDGGRVFSLKSGKELKSYQGKDGYFRICLYKNGVKHTHKLYQIVFYSFHPNISKDKGYEIDHIDNDKSNNSLSNLRKITSRENTAKSKHPKFRRGVRYFANIGKFGASISIEGESYHLGVFPNEEDASRAYYDALRNWNDSKIKPYKAPKDKKFCKCCGRWLDKNNFYYVKGHGYSYLCKECHKEQMKERRKTTNK